MCSVAQYKHLRSSRSVVWFCVWEIICIPLLRVATYRMTMPEVSVGADISLEMEKEIKDLKDALLTEIEPSKRKELEEEIQNKEKTLSDIQKQMEDEAQSPSPRKSARKPAPTLKMIALQREMAEKKTQTLLNAYEKWKLNVRKAKNQLKFSVPEN